MARGVKWMLWSAVLSRGIDNVRSVDERVAVAGWQWYHSIAEINAVILILDRVWQWQYWQSDELNKNNISGCQKMAMAVLNPQQVAVAGW
jgi:hypothetical protein